MKLSLAPFKICDWALNLSHDHGIRHSHKVHFQCYVIQCHGPTCFALGEAKKVIMLQTSKDHGKEMFFFIFFCQAFT